MNLIFRLFYLVIQYRFRKKLRFFEEAETPFRALPTDIDFNLHINNGIYLSLMDLGRFDLTFRNGLLKIALKNKIYPLVASQAIRYTRSINLFEKFSIKTKVLGWDDRFFYLQQRFICKGKVSALAVVKAKFKQAGKGGIKPEEFVSLCKEDPTSPKLPHWVNEWIDSEEHAWQEIKESNF
ncbi:MAG: thioesterase [Bdellovibrionaceae bacterium]|nr:thioesterase [Pseudobdellovibrionaceae bacterium]|tara:strand:+ start:2152 stop:2694 length:543 start_codon:yes stop_codon:yes gene_type:complete